MSVKTFSDKLDGVPVSRFLCAAALGYAYMLSVAWIVHHVVVDDGHVNVVPTYPGTQALAPQTCKVTDRIRNFAVFDQSILTAQLRFPTFLDPLFLSRSCQCLPITTCKSRAVCVCGAAGRGDRSLDRSGSDKSNMTCRLL